MPSESYSQGKGGGGEETFFPPLSIKTRMAMAVSMGGMRVYLNRFRYLNLCVESSHTIASNWYKDMENQTSSSLSSILHIQPTLSSV